MSNKSLIYIAGPTAIGKTKISIELAKKLNTEIISCDSRQFYKELKIGTAPPTQEELSEVKHHFIQNKSINEIYTVGDFEKEAINKINALFNSYDKLIMVGGSGLYADAIMFGLDKFPKIPKEIRDQVNLFYKTHGLIALQELLLEKDPKYYTRIDKNNYVRLIRALEVCIYSGKPYSSFLGKIKGNRKFISKMAIIDLPREKLYEKINKRVDFMIKMGLEKEVKNLFNYRKYPALNTVGYKELFSFFEGKIKFEEAINEIKKNTRRYAKRQITWLKKYENAMYFKNNTPIAEIYNSLID
tara:strand:- start:289 stop:1188 length:900 start_codon:yes stop_codon:yes gene_type:complete